MVTLKKT
jgi:hypothetical protein